MNRKSSRIRKDISYLDSEDAEEEVSGEKTTESEDPLEEVSQILGLNKNKSKKSSDKNGKKKKKESPQDKEESSKEKIADKKKRKKNNEISNVVDGEADQSTTRKRRMTKNKKLPTNENGDLDLQQVTLSDLILYGGAYGKRIEPVEQEKEVAQEVEKEVNEEDPGIPPTAEEDYNPLRRHNAESGDESRKLYGPAVRSSAPQSNHIGPRMTIINGELVLEEESLTVNAEDMQEPDTTEYIGMKAKKGRSIKWTTEETDKFYFAIRQFGSDFSLIERLFPNRSRKQIKDKFKREEKSNPSQIDFAFRNRLPINVDVWKQASLLKAEANVEKLPSVEEPPIAEKVPQPEKEAEAPQNVEQNENSDEEDVLQYRFNKNRNNAEEFQPNNFNNDSLSQPPALPESARKPEEEETAQENENVEEEPEEETSNQNDDLDLDGTSNPYL